MALTEAEKGRAQAGRPHDTPPGVLGVPESVAGGLDVPPAGVGVGVPTSGVMPTGGWDPPDPPAGVGVAGGGALPPGPVPPPDEGGFPADGVGVGVPAAASLG